MYRNSLTPSKVFGLILLLLATAGLLVWLTCLADIEAPAFDADGLTLLGTAGGLFILSLLFFRRTRWVRIVASVLLHVLALVVLATLFYTVPEATDARETMTVVAVTLLMAGLLIVAILTLHSDAMIRDFANRRTVDMIGRRCKRAYAPAVAGFMLLLSLAAWQVIPLLFAKPAITVDYPALANQAGKPADYDPNRNAAPHYEKFFAGFVPLPEALRNKWRLWPADLGPDESKTLEEWGAVNKSALAALAAAAQCPYWWLEMQSDDGALSSVRLSCAIESRDCTWGTLLLAKYKASRGDVDGALQLVSDLHMLGMHRIRGGTLANQLAGLAICVASQDAVFAMLHHCALERNVLRQTLDTFAARIPDIEAPQFCEVEYLYGLDGIQRVFTDDGNGNGRLIPGPLHESKKHGGLYVQPLSYLDAVRICLTHPSRQDTLQLFEVYFAFVKELARRTPWESYAEGASYEEQLERWLSGNFYLRDGVASVAECIRVGWRGRLSGQALLATLAILTYQAQEGRLPESLKRLVSAGLLPTVPVDPFSGAPLIYRAAEGNFLLYSVGEDFVDDGGRRCEWDGWAGGDHVFWPVQSPTDAGEPEEQL